MALKLYMTPGSCSTGIHILLETLELPFEAWIINIPAGDNLRPEYLKINPRGTIPTLVLNDGLALTDFKSIALWLAETYPRGKLLPEDPALAQRAIDLLDFALIQLHGEGFTRIFTTERYISSSEAGQGHLKDDVAAHGREIVTQAFGILEKRLPTEGYAVGPQFSIADAALFYNEFGPTGIPLPSRSPRITSACARGQSCARCWLRGTEPDHPHLPGAAGRVVDGRCAAATGDA
jgi:glutathione S-transferase